MVRKLRKGDGAKVREPRDEGTEETVSPLGPGAEALRPFLGRWVALDAIGKVCGDGATSDEAREAAARLHVQEPELFFLPPQSLIA